MIIDVLLGLGLALPVTAGVGIGTVTGVAQGVSQQQKINAENNNEARQIKFHIDIRVETSSGREKSRGRVQEVDGGIVVLRNDKLYIEPKSATTRQPENVDSHPFTGFYFQYPDEDRAMTRGMVSTITRDPPVLNWIYVDKETFEVKYSNRTGSIAHHVGDFDWTSEEGPDSCVTFDGWEGFVAIEEVPAQKGKKGQWAVYFDKDDDGLQGKKKGRRSVEVTLMRRVIAEQELNKWGVGQQGNIGFKTTREV